LVKSFNFKERQGPNYVGLYALVVFVGCILGPWVFFLLFLFGFFGGCFCLGSFVGCFWVFFQVLGFFCGFCSGFLGLALVSPVYTSCVLRGALCFFSLIFLLAYQKN